MVALYVTSLRRSSGKTAICAGLGKHLLSDGKKTGYFKPVIADSKKLPMEDIDSDAAFVKDLFALDEPLDLLCPVFGDESNLRTSIKDTYSKVSQDKDVVIIEGICDQSQAARDMVEALDARVIVVDDYVK